MKIYSSLGDVEPSSRDDEAAMLARCVAIAQPSNPVQGVGAYADLDQRDANIFRVASMIIQSRFPTEASRLRFASHAYFQLKPDDIVHPAELMQRGWVISLPRLRDMLSRRLR